MEKDVRVLSSFNNCENKVGLSLFRISTGNVHKQSFWYSDWITLCTLHIACWALLERYQLTVAAPAGAKLKYYSLFFDIREKMPNSVVFSPFHVNLQSFLCFLLTFPFPSMSGDSSLPYNLSVPTWTPHNHPQNLRNWARNHAFRLENLHPNPLYHLLSLFNLILQGIYPQL